MFFPYGLETKDERRSWLTEALVFMNVLPVFLLAFRSSKEAEWIFTRWGFKPLEPSVVEATTSMFLHAHWAHLAGNMLFLWIFGRGLERTLGRVKLILVYIASGWAGALFHALFIAETAKDIPAIGSSAAISGLLGAVAIVLPTARVRCIYFSLGSWAPVRLGVPASLFAVGWFFFQVFLAVFFSSEMQGVAVWAHVGGFAIGAVLALLMDGLPQLLRARRRAAFSRLLERAFEAFCRDGHATDIPSSKLAGAGVEELFAAGLIQGTLPASEPATAASAFLNRSPSDRTGREVVRAVDALAQVGRNREAVAAVGLFLATHERDPAEPELLAQTERLLRRRLEQPDLSGLFRSALIERYPESMQASEARRTAKKDMDD